MAWVGPDKQYGFTIARLLEGFLEIDSLTVNGVDVIVGGVVQTVTPSIHYGDNVSIDMTAINTGKTTDDFEITIDVVGVSSGTSILSESADILGLAVNSTSSYAPTDFTMPDENVDVTINTFHYEEAVGAGTWVWDTSSVWDVDKWY